MILDTAVASCSADIHKQSNNIATCVNIALISSERGSWVVVYKEVTDKRVHTENDVYLTPATTEQPFLSLHFPSNPLQSILGIEVLPLWLLQFLQ